MEIPENAQRVFKGIIFDVYQWQQKMFDGSLKTFEMIKRQNTIRIISTQGNKIVLAREEQPTKSSCFSLFGGRQEEGENSLDTAKRELKEESGLESSDWELIKTFEGEHKIHHQISLFVARNCKKVFKQKLDSGEKIELRKVSFKDFLRIIYSDKLWDKQITDYMFRIKGDKKKLGDLKKKIFNQD